jgi:hypothetical protein
MVLTALAVAAASAQAWVLRSPELEARLDPARGRLVHLSTPGGTNLLWTSEDPEGGKGRYGGWANWGGDKLWPSPQAAWGWPPPQALDGAPHHARRIGDRIEMESGVCAKTGLQFRRTFELRGATLHVRNEMRNRGRRTVEHGIWQIAQIDDPTWVRVPTRKTFGFPKGWRPYPDSASDPRPIVERESCALFVRDSHKSWKIASEAQPYRLEAYWEKHGVLLRLEMEADPKGPFPDGGSPLQVFSSPNPDAYMELEVAGPLSRLRPGARAILSTRLTLVPLSKQVAPQ